MANLIFLGPPGAGKGTQASMVADQLNLAHISTGEILRTAVREATALGKEAKAYMDRGELVPDQLVIGLVQERLQSLNGHQGWILDGFPRNESQAQALDALLAEIDQPSDCAINLEVPDEVLVERLLKRGRKDDSEAVIRTRLQVYRDETAPLIDFYRSRHHLVSIDGNTTVDQVTQRIHQAIHNNSTPLNQT